MLNLVWDWFWQGGGWLPSICISTAICALSALFALAFNQAYNLGRRAHIESTPTQPIVVDTRPRYVREAESAACAAAQRRSIDEPL